ncbi:endonuclease domain-containing protein [Vulcaniibacterium thermophilum]|uniref:endonuclease domain-containing protein n=1 Tax=Vulcaniibacterium thermophilum TaxID=1169913 RepID=UPI0011B6C60B|nr:endonuclease domain-containing protein [Vulcaniibacterium thermophilum]
MQGQTNRAILGRRLQRRLRHAMTDAERRLWSALRGRRLDGCKFRRQHPYFDYVLDFVCLERRLVVEVGGGQHNGSAADLERDAFLVRGGFEVLRFWNHEVLQHLPEVADRILAALIRRRPHHPLPNPPLEGEGEKHAPTHQDADDDMKPSPSRGGLGGDGVPTPSPRANHRPPQPNARDETTPSPSRGGLGGDGVPPCHRKPPCSTRS